MSKKLLVVNLQNPEQTKYRTPKGIGSWFLGRRLSNYGVFVVEGGVFTQLIFNSADPSQIQETVNNHIGENLYD